MTDAASDAQPPLAKRRGSAHDGQIPAVHLPWVEYIPALDATQSRPAPDVRASALLLLDDQDLAVALADILEAMSGDWVLEAARSLIPVAAA